MITMMLNKMKGKRVQIVGEYFVEKGILWDLAAEANPMTPQRCHFRARLKKENGDLNNVFFCDLANITLDEEAPAPYTMDKLNTIQKRENLNCVYRVGEPGPGGAYHDYDIYCADVINPTYGPHPELALACIEFQNGPRNDPNARHGVLDCDLLEIVRDRFKAFQAGPYATKEIEMALYAIENALMWMNRRVEDSIERGVLGTMEK